MKRVSLPDSPWRSRGIPESRPSRRLSRVLELGWQRGQSPKPPAAEGKAPVPHTPRAAAPSHHRCLVFLTPPVPSAPHTTGPSRPAAAGPSRPSRPAAAGNGLLRRRNPKKPESGAPLPAPPAPLPTRLSPPSIHPSFLPSQPAALMRPERFPRASPSGLGPGRGGRCGGGGRGHLPPAPGACAAPRQGRGEEFRNRRMRAGAASPLGGGRGGGKEERRKKKKGEKKKPPQSYVRKRRICARGDPRGAGSPRDGRDTRALLTLSAAPPCSPPSAPPLRAQPALPPPPP